MKTTRIMNIDALRNELALDILQIDDIEMLDKVNRTLRRTAKVKAEFVPISGVPSTIKEVKQRIAEFEAELDAGTLETVTPEESNAWIRKELP